MRKNPFLLSVDASLSVGGSAAGNASVDLMDESFDDDDGHLTMLDEQSMMMLVFVFLAISVLFLPFISFFSNSVICWLCLHLPHDYLPLTSSACFILLPSVLESVLHSV